MDRQTVQQKIRERLASGVLPRHVPPLTRSGAPRTTAPPTQISADTAIRLARCSGCDGEGAHVAVRLPSGAILRFHGRCHRIWEEECAAAS